MCGGEGVEGEACKVRRERRQEGREEEMCACVVGNGDIILECDKPHNTMVYDNN